MMTMTMIMTTICHCFRAVTNSSCCGVLVNVLRFSPGMRRTRDRFQPLFDPTRSCCAASMCCRAGGTGSYIFKSCIAGTSLIVNMFGMCAVWSNITHHKQIFERFVPIRMIMTTFYILYFKCICHYVKLATGHCVSGTQKCLINK